MQYAVYAKESIRHAIKKMKIRETLGRTVDTGYRWMGTCSQGWDEVAVLNEKRLEKDERVSEVPGRFEHIPK